MDGIQYECQTEQDTNVEFHAFGRTWLYQCLRIAVTCSSS